MWRNGRNVLITAASRRVALVEAFGRVVAMGGGAVIVTDVNPLSPAVYAADRAYRVPLASDPAYLDEVLDIAVAERVNLVVPTIDDELPLFASARERFEAHGISVAVSPHETTLVCNDKLATCQALKDNGVAAAATYLPGNIPDDVAFPLFVKPRLGRGGVGAFAIRSRRELQFFVHYVPDAVIQEFLEGPEYTIDMLCDFTGRPLSIVPRERVVIRAGVIDRGRTAKDARLIDLAAACADAIPFAGAVNIQCRIVDGRPVIFEINPRFSGGIPLTIEAGADFPRMLVDLAAGRMVEPSIGAFRDDLWMTNYETSVFLDGSRVALDTYRPHPIAEVA
jgi:carbamoyl-phosphate synthase large subunit